VSLLSWFRFHVVITHRLHLAVQLRVLDIGNNLIEQWKDVRSLRLLPRLVNLNLKGNPLARTEDYSDECISRFPHLFIMDGMRRSEKPPPHPLALAIKNGGIPEAESGGKPTVEGLNSGSKAISDRTAAQSEATVAVEPRKDTKREKKRPREPVPVLTPAEPSDDEHDGVELPLARAISASGVVSVKVTDQGDIQDEELPAAVSEAAVVVPAKAAKKSKHKGAMKGAIDIAATLKTAVPVIGQGGVGTGWD
jgi:hypothetical protein